MTNRTHIRPVAESLSSLSTAKCARTASLLHACRPTCCAGRPAAPEVRMA